ncbi:twin-arginine translocation signal domain-containing protein [Oscillibacter sp.]
MSRRGFLKKSGAMGLSVQAFGMQTRIYGFLLKST